MHDAGFDIDETMGLKRAKLRENDRKAIAFSTVWCVFWGAEATDVPWARGPGLDSLNSKKTRKPPRARPMDNGQMGQWTMDTVR